MTGQVGVSASTQAAVSTGIGILLGGGNAADAAVAAGFAACVADPCNCGLGGYGGEAVVDAGRQGVWTVSFRMTAPAALTFEALAGPHPEVGPGASVPPRVPAGLARLLDDFGTMAWADVLCPAQRLAADGVRLDPTPAIAVAAHEGADVLQECLQLSDAAGARVMRQPVLARTLDMLATLGPAWFYEGEVADRAAAAFAAAGASVTREDWAGAPESVAVARAPALDLGGASVFTSTLATTGAPCMLAFLHALHAASQIDDVNRSPAVVAIARAMASVWQYRLTTPAGNDMREDALFQWIDDAISFGPEVIPIPRGRGHTTHLNVIDTQGMAVALTMTHGPQWFGARWAIPGTGIIMNDGLHLFEGAKPVVRRGAIYPVNDMAPTIVRHGNGSRIAIGSPGARRIPGNVALALGRRLFGGMSLADAVAAPRIFSEQLGAVSIEDDRIDAELRTDLSHSFQHVAREAWQDCPGPLTAVEQHGNGRVHLGLDDRRTCGFGQVVG